MKLSKAELQDKIKRDLCFRCDEKYGPNHICKNKQLHMLLLTEEEMTGLEVVQDKPEANDEMGAAKGQVLQLS